MCCAQLSVSKRACFFLCAPSHFVAMLVVHYGWNLDVSTSRSFFFVKNTHTHSCQREQYELRIRRDWNTLRVCGEAKRSLSLSLYLPLPHHLHRAREKKTRNTVKNNMPLTPFSKVIIGKLKLKQTLSLSSSSSHRRDHSYLIKWLYLIQMLFASTLLYVCMFVRHRLGAAAAIRSTLFFFLFFFVVFVRCSYKHSLYCSLKIALLFRLLQIFHLLLLCVCRRRYN